MRSGPKAVPKLSWADVEAGLLGLLGVGAGLLELRVQVGLAEMLEIGAGSELLAAVPAFWAAGGGRPAEPLGAGAGLCGSVASKPACVSSWASTPATALLESRPVCLSRGRRGRRDGHVEVEGGLVEQPEVEDGPLEHVGVDAGPRGLPGVAAGLPELGAGVGLAEQLEVDAGVSALLGAGAGLPEPESEEAGLVEQLVAEAGLFETVGVDAGLSSLNAPS